MAFRRHGDRIKETSPTTGTGTLDLAGAPTGFQSFSQVFDSGQAEIPYLSVDSVDNPTSWEVGYGTFTNASPDTFARNTVHASTNGGSKVAWAAGCIIINCLTSEWANTLGEMMKVAQKTGAYTVALGDRGRTIEATSGTWTLTLPAVSSAGNGFWFAFRNTGSGVVTLDGNSSETIDGATTLATAQGDSCLIICTGTAWVTVGRSTAASDTAPGIIEIAVQSEMEAGTDTTRAVTPGRLHFHTAVAKAWVNFNGSGTVAVRASYNLDGSTPLTDNGAGDWTINLGNDMSSANYCAVGSTGSGAATQGRNFFLSPEAANPTAGTWRVKVLDFNGSGSDQTFINVAFFGDL